MAILSTIFYFIITIGILVLVHELGHFLAAICAECVPKYLLSEWATGFRLEQKHEIFIWQIEEILI